MQTTHRPIDGTRHDGRAMLTPEALVAELAYLRPHDPAQRTTPGTVPGTYRITTAGHGYTAVPLTHTWEREARAVCSYGYTGKLAVYLDADYEAPAFADRVKKREAVHSLQATRVPVQTPTCAGFNNKGKCTNAPTLGDYCQQCADNIPW